METLTSAIAANRYVSRFRTRRGAILQRQILETARILGRDVEVLDIGGRAAYWRNVGLRGVARVILLNTHPADAEASAASLPAIFEECVGDGRDLRDFADASVDLAHSNSVIEHVGGWDEIAVMASEAARVGRSGWIQTPALEFPVEPHFYLPFVHWLPPTLRPAALRLSPVAHFRRGTPAERKLAADEIHLLSKRDLRTLFPGRDILTERLLFPKSYVVRWQAGPA